MAPDTMWIIETEVTVGVALAGVMYALVNGTHRRIDDVNKRIDDVRIDLQRLHDDHKGVEERLRMIEAS